MSKTNPPKWADQFLEWYCHPDLLEDLQGDLYEIHERLYANGSPFKAKLIYAWLVIRSFRTSTIRSNLLTNYSLKMTRNNFKIAFRVMDRNRFNTVLNLGGLAIGIACFLLIGFYAKQELSYDRFHTKSDRIARVWLKEIYAEDQIFFNSVTPLRFESLLKDHFDEFEHVVQFDNQSFLVGNVPNRNNEVVAVISPEFFEVFDFEIITGTSAQVFQDKNSVILSERYATKYFGSDNPINQDIPIQIGEETREFRVSAIFKDIQKESSISMDMAISNDNNLEIYGEGSMQAWFNVSPETYTLLTPNANIESVEEKLPEVIMSYLEGRVDEGVYNLGFQPLTDIHLNLDIPLGIAPVGNPMYVYVLISISLLVLVIACINYTTLSIGQSFRRGREVGMRKVMGALKGSLVNQYLAESIAIAFLATAAGIAITYLALPGFNSLTGVDVSLAFEPWHLALYLSITLIIGIFAGIYPAFVLSRMNITSVLKGTNQSKLNQTSRKAMVVFQFIITVFLISSTLIMKRQLNYIHNKDLGYNYEATVSVPLYPDPSSQRLSEFISSGMENGEQFKEKLSLHPTISKIGMGSHVFGTPGWGNLAYTDENGVFRRFRLLVTDPWYFETFDVKMKDGRKFDAENPLDARQSIIVNEAAVKFFGLENGVGDKLPGNEFGEHMIIGVTENFNYSSLHADVEPLVITQNIQPIYAAISDHDYGDSPIPKLVFKYSGSRLSDVKEILETEWKRTFPGEELNFAFVEENMKAQYIQEEQMNKMITVATILSLLIASFGLLGLTVMVVNAREKEIGIRKVNGASSTTIFSLLAKSFSIPLLIGSILSIPLTLWLMAKWLGEFAFKISIGVENFIISSLLALIIALLVISYHTAKASAVNPVKSLRSE